MIRRGLETQIIRQYRIHRELSRRGIPSSSLAMTDADD